jgi:hypothetical protein
VARIEVSLSLHVQNIKTTLPFSPPFATRSGAIRTQESGNATITGTVELTDDPDNSLGKVVYELYMGGATPPPEPGAHRLIARVRPQRAYAPFPYSQTRTAPQCPRRPPHPGIPWSTATAPPADMSVDLMSFRSAASKVRGAIAPRA